MNIRLYTDGGCSGNPGPGGWGCVLQAVMPDGKLYEVEHSGGFRLTTNNRMELMAVIEGLRSVNGRHDVEVISDSSYVCKAFNEGWIYGWAKKGWMKKPTEPVPNRDLWKELLTLINTQNSVSFTWVKGHAGRTLDEKVNDRCDVLAVSAYQDPASLPADMGYEGQDEL